MTVLEKFQSMNSYTEFNQVMSEYSWSEIYSNWRLGEVIGKAIIDFIRRDGLEVITHNGVYHTDDVMAASLLRLEFGNDLKITRTRDPKVLNSHFTFDVGGMSFDHHSTNDCRVEGDPSTCLSSIGKLWLTVGRYVMILSESSWKMIDSELIQPVDRTDNTGIMNPVNFIVNAGRPAWNSGKDMDSAFKDAVISVVKIFRQLLTQYSAVDVANKVIEDAIKESSDGVIRLKTFVPTNDMETLKENQIKLITWPKGPDDVMIKSVDSNEIKIPQDLKDAIPGVEFVHKSGFICQVKKDHLEEAISYIAGYNA